MVPVILLAAALLDLPDSVQHRAVVRPASAVFEFPVQFDPGWTVGPAQTRERAPAYEWTVSTVVRDTVFSFGYRLYQDTSGAGTAIPFAEARARLGERRLHANGLVDPAVAIDVVFQAARVIVRLDDASAIRRVFALRPRTVQFSQRVPGRAPQTIDVAVDYAGDGWVADISSPAQPHAELADSTYLHLVLELPVLGTFSYDLVTRDRVINMYSNIRDVEIERCTMTFQVWAQNITRSGQLPLPRNFFDATFAIPLNAIDPKSLTVGIAHPRGNSRYEPQPWLLHMAVRRDSKARIMVGALDRSYKRPTRSIDLTLKDYETAALIKSWLTDAAHRCETWNTAPLKAIR